MNKVKKVYKRIEELEKRVAALEGQVQAQPPKIAIEIDGKSISQSLANYDTSQVVEE